MSIINFSFLGQNNLIKSETEKKANTNESIKTEIGKKSTNFEELLEIKELEMLSSVDTEENASTENIIVQSNTIKEPKELEETPKGIVLLNQEADSSLNGLSASRTNSTDYYTNQGAMVIRNQILFDYLNGNKQL